MPLLDAMGGGGELVLLVPDVRLNADEVGTGLTSPAKADGSEPAATRF